MKKPIRKYLVPVLSFSFLVLAEAAPTWAAEVVQLSSDHATYSVGSHAMLTATFASWPTNSNMAYVIESKVGTQPPLLIQNTPGQREVFETGTLSRVGVNTWSVTAYLENSQQVASLEEKQNLLRRQALGLQEEGATTSDPVKKAQIGKRLFTLQQQMASVAVELRNAKQVVETDSLQFTVTR